MSATSATQRSEEQPAAGASPPESRGARIKSRDSLEVFIGPSGIGKQMFGETKSHALKEDVGLSAGVYARVIRPYGRVIAGLVWFAIFFTGSELLIERRQDAYTYAPRLFDGSAAVRTRAARPRRARTLSASSARAEHYGRAPQTAASRHAVKTQARRPGRQQVSRCEHL